MKSKFTEDGDKAPTIQYIKLEYLVVQYSTDDPTRPPPSPELGHARIAIEHVASSRRSPLMASIHSPSFAQFPFHPTLFGQLNKSHDATHSEREHGLFGMKDYKITTCGGGRCDDHSNKDGNDDG